MHREHVGKIENITWYQLNLISHELQRPVNQWTSKIRSTHIFMCKYGILHGRRVANHSSWGQNVQGGCTRGRALLVS